MIFSARFLRQIKRPDKDNWCLVLIFEYQSIKLNNKTLDAFVLTLDNFCDLLAVSLNGI